MKRIACLLLLVAAGTVIPAGAEENRPPEAVFKTNPEAAEDGRILVRSRHKVTFNMCLTHDPDPGDRLRFRYEYGDDTSAHGRCRRSKVYRRGTWCATVCVSDRQPDHELCRAYVVEVQ